MSKNLKPGSKAKVSAQYEIIGADGRDTGVERTVPKGHKLPPPPKKNQTYKVNDATKNKSGSLKRK